MPRLVPIRSSLTHSLRQLWLVVAGFVAAIVLLDSGGLASWANHLDIGLLRSVAVPVTAGLEAAVHVVRADELRQAALNGLARAGWSDDAAMVAEAEVPAKTSGTHIDTHEAAPSHQAAGVTSAGGDHGKVSQPSGLKLPGANGTAAALAASVPRLTALPPLPPVGSGRPRVVALAGDSMMAVGLSATLMRQAAGHPNLKIVKAFRSGTGLARPEVFNWMHEYPAMVGSATPDVVIVAIGANDGQGFVENGKVMPYGSEEWKRVYQARLADYLAMVSATGAKVVWVGLPPMRGAVYNEKIAAINRIAYSVVSQNPQATWWNTVTFVGDDAGGFREFVTQPNGRSMRIRATDGIHLSDEGAGLLTSVLLPWLDPPEQIAAMAEPANPIPAAPAAHAPTGHASPAKGRRRGRHSSRG